MAIQGFANREIERFFVDGRPPRGAGWARVAKVAARKLVVLDYAEALRDLRSPPGNRLEALKGDRRGQHSIPINDRLRICFVWRGGDAHDVEIVDDH